MELGNLTNPSELKVWIPFQEDAEIEIRYIALKELTKLQKKATSKSMKKGQIIDEVDHIALGKLLGRAAVTGWKNLTVKGEEFPFTKDNCDLLMGMSYDFNSFVNEKAVELSNFVEREDGEALGKSEPTPSGGSQG